MNIILISIAIYLIGVIIAWICSAYINDKHNTDLTLQFLLSWIFVIAIIIVNIIIYLNSVELLKHRPSLKILKKEKHNKSK